MPSHSKARSINITYFVIICLVFGETSFRLFFIFIILQAILTGVIYWKSSEILRFFYGFRDMLTVEEKAILGNAFENVVSDYKELVYKNHNTKEYVSLYMDNSMSVNAYAVGQNGVAITRGALYSLSNEELEGLIAHETGHLYNGDTILTLVVNFGFILTFPIVLLAKLFDNSSNKNNRSSGKILAYLTFPFRAMSMAVVRRNEYFADKFAFDLGYGNGLKDALNKISKMDMSGQKMVSIMERLQLSHPDIFMRIIKLEKSL